MGPKLRRSARNEAKKVSFAQPEANEAKEDVIMEEPESEATSSQALNNAHDEPDISFHAVSVLPPLGRASRNPAEVEEEILIQDNEVNEIPPSEDEEADWLSDDEVEETYVVADVNGFIDTKLITDRINEGLCKVRHPASPNPIVQIGGQLFAGKYKESDGSMMLIEEHQEIDRKSFTLTAVTDVILDAQKTYLFAKGKEPSNAITETFKKPIGVKLDQMANKALPQYFKKKL